MTTRHKTKIPIENLSVGMLVTGVDRPWYATPFMSHRMTITNEGEIATLRACGVRVVEVEVAEPPAAPAPAKEGSAAETRESGRSESAPHSNGQAVAPLTTTHPQVTQTSAPVEGAQTPFEEELKIAQVGYHQARLAVQRAMNDAKMGRAFGTEAMAAAVDALADSIMRNSHALASLSRLKHIDEYLYYHSVNTCVLSMALGRQLNMGREPLKQLGLGVLLHDVGKTQVPVDVLTKHGRLSGDETEAIKQHVMRGVEFLRDTLKLDSEVILPVLEHHERMDGSGYPHQRKRSELSEFGLIAGVVDVYDALTSDRPYRQAVSPHQALQMLYDLARRGQLDSACVERFIRCMGIYPVGSCVKLNSGEIGIVSKINPSQTLNPVVLIVRESPAGAIVTPRPLDMSHQSGRLIKRITEVIHPASAGIVPNDVLDACPLSAVA